MLRHKTTFPSLVVTANDAIFYNGSGMNFLLFDDNGYEIGMYGNFADAEEGLAEHLDRKEGKLPFREVIAESTLRLLGVVETGNAFGVLREGLQETPKRVAKAWAHWTSGYSVDVAGLLKVFEDGAENYDQMVVVRDIPIYSKCEHHLADIFGTCDIAYIPNGKVVGLSKLSRLADAFARRLQVQERLTAQIADALEEHLQPLGVGVVIKARHMCMESRGICQQGHHTVTSALRGKLKDDPQARAEFLALAK